MAKLNVGGLVFTVIFLYLGAFIANFIVPMVPVIPGWTTGIFIGIIQMLVLSVFGMLTGKLDLWNILMGGVVIFIGGIIGGFIADFMDIAGLIATVIILFVQAAILILLGFVKGEKSAKIL